MSSRRVRQPDEDDAFLADVYVEQPVKKKGSWPKGKSHRLNRDGDLKRDNPNERITPLRQIEMKKEKDQQMLKGIGNDNFYKINENNNEDTKGNDFVFLDKIIGNFGPLRGGVQGKFAVTHTQEKMFDLSPGKSKLKIRYFVTHFSFRFATMLLNLSYNILKQFCPYKK